MSCAAVCLRREAINALCSENSSRNKLCTGLRRLVPAMNSLLVNELCCLFCCPPCPGLITVKLTFLPPGPTYSLVPEPEPRLGGPGPPLREPWPAAPRALEAPPAGARQLLYSQRKLDTIEVLATKSSWVIHVSCMYLCCVPSARYMALFLQGNAVDLGQMSSFCIGLGTRIKCNISSNYFGYRVSLGKPLEKNLYADSGLAGPAHQDETNKSLTLQYQIVGKIMNPVIEQIVNIHISRGLLNT
ncbi:hypothetical protein EI555_007541 [Monodon monoceros]|uniref:Uncharacterized protein n=1 Tax=Monodon monoceros TaxID=40151 RepID=A0A4U1FSM5_MONMO|nr:hypothetical protein EI555_007541 [Monodon monoceros]